VHNSSRKDNRQTTPLPFPHGYTYIYIRALNRPEVKVVLQHGRGRVRRRPRVTRRRRHESSKVHEGRGHAGRVIQRRHSWPAGWLVCVAAAARWPPCCWGVHCAHRGGHGGGHRSLLAGRHASQARGRHRLVEQNQAVGPEHAARARPPDQRRASRNYTRKKTTTKASLSSPTRQIPALTEGVAVGFLRCTGGRARQRRRARCPASRPRWTRRRAPTSRPRPAPAPPDERSLGTVSLVRP